MTSREQIIYNMLRKAAEHRDECPTNSLLANAIGTGSTAVAASVIKGLQAKGLIQVEKVNRAARRVTITATGDQTRVLYSTNPTAVYERQRKQRVQADKAAAIEHRDMIAEHVANGLSIDAAAKALGLGRDYGRLVWRAVVAGMGPQAI